MASFSTVRVRFFAVTGANPTDAHAPVSGPAAIENEVSEWQKMADVAAESMENKTKKAGDLTPSLKPYALRGVRGFGLYNPYICAGYPGNN